MPYTIFLVPKPQICGFRTSVRPLRAVEPLLAARSWPDEPSARSGICLRPPRVLELLIALSGPLHEVVQASGSGTYSCGGSILTAWCETRRRSRRRRAWRRGCPSCVPW